jgi:hypothetical protein
MASSKINTIRELKRKNVSYTLSDYSKSGNYYTLPVPTDHHYILAGLVDWGNANASPFSFSYNIGSGNLYLIVGTSEPTNVTFYLWYYE